MNAITPLREDAETVTLSRADWEVYLDWLEDQQDYAIIAADRAERERLGEAEYRRLCVTGEEMRRILDGTHDVTIWRERAGLSQSELARQAEVSVGYVNDIEAGRKPGSAATLKKLAKVLNVPLDMLVRDERRDRSQAE